MNALPITVIIPTLNAEGHLSELLDSISGVADVFIVDSRSTDRTVDIALERGVKIVQRPFAGFGDQCRWMLEKLPIATPWIFCMAQDERFSESLRNELREVLTDDRGEYNGYTVRWRLWFMGKPLHAVTDNPRLFRMGRVLVSDVVCNEHFIIAGKTGHLKGILEHKDTLSLHEWYAKQNLYTTWEAIERIRGKGAEETPKLFGDKLQRKMFFKRCFIRIPGGRLVMMLHYLFAFGAWRDGRVGWTWAKLRIWVHDTGTLKEREMRATGIVPEPPMAPHGGFDPRILASELQRRLLPETISVAIKNSGNQ